ncbi:MAG TPA: hypothetical protein DCL54_13060 [Alphaproteobacteria bacterium]|nr:hypothetical protein [Alphaproteobacteria bacterium]HAJ47499.1 hypothetical protein [Alphaproteobacteria bacterium]
MSLVEQVKSETLKEALAVKPAEFQEQLKKFRALKDRLDGAGLVYGDKFEIPLMARIGHVVPG